MRCSSSAGRVWCEPVPNWYNGSLLRLRLLQTIVVLQTVGLLPEPRRLELYVDGVDVAVNELSIDVAGAFARGGVVVVAVAAVAAAAVDDDAVVDDDGALVVPILSRDQLLDVPDAVVGDAELIEHEQNDAMDDEDDARVEIVALNLDELADSERSEDDTSTLHNVQVALLRSELVHQHHFYIRCKPSAVLEFVHLLQH